MRLRRRTPFGPGVAVGTRHQLRSKAVVIIKNDHRNLRAVPLTRAVWLAGTVWSTWTVRSTWTVWLTRTPGATWTPTAGATLAAAATGTTIAAATTTAAAAWLRESDSGNTRGCAHDQCSGNENRPDHSNGAA